MNSFSINDSTNISFSELASSQGAPALPFSGSARVRFTVKPTGPHHAPNEESKSRDDSKMSAFMVDTSYTSKKRTVCEDSIDDILGQICSKMTSLTTADRQTGREEMIEAFISVLDCSSEEAEFFLESSLWDIQAAVMLWFDTGKGEGDGKRMRNQSEFHNTQSFYSHPIAPPRYLPRRVSIDGLPEGWAARVSRTDGSIVFLHIASGHQQRCVPPGFADALATDISENPNQTISTEHIAMTTDSGQSEISSLIGDDGIDSIDSINSSQGVSVGQSDATVIMSAAVADVSCGNIDTQDNRWFGLEPSAMQQDETNNIM